MGMISRYFERLAARVQGRRPGPPAISADAAGLRIGGDLLAWSEVRRLEACKRDAYVGDCLCLAILGAGDRVFEITEASPGWEAAGDAIERFLPGSMAHAEWMVRLIAATPGQSLAIYPVA
jgi:hypothetical protein